MPVSENWITPSSQRSVSCDVGRCCRQKERLLGDPQGRGSTVYLLEGYKGLWVGGRECRNGNGQK